MSRSDQIAIKVKFQLCQLEKLGWKVKRIVVGRDDMVAIVTNPEPCDPPDYNQKQQTFCGVPLIKTTEAKTGVAYGFE